MRRGTPKEVVNSSINQTLSRTIMSAGLTLLVVVALFFLPFVRLNLRRILDLHYIPINGWFYVAEGESWYFFFGKLLELSPFCVFSYLSIPLCFKENSLLRILVLYVFCIFFRYLKYICTMFNRIRFLKTNRCFFGPLF